jgi:integrase
LITVSLGYDVDGNKLTRTKTVKLDKGLTAKQAEKEVQRQAALFQEEVEKGTHLDGGKITLAEFIDRWMQDAEKRLQPKTIYEYKGLLDRVLPALGHLKLDKIRPNHLMEFYSNLSEVGLRRDIKHIALPALKEKMKALGMKQADVADKAGLHPATVMAAVNGSPTSKAAEIAEALGVAVKDIFIPKDKPRPLSSNTIHHYHRFLSSVLTSAVQWQLIFSNPAERVKPPRVEKKEAAHYDEDQAEKVLRLLESEPMKYQCMVALTIFAGLRRGELCGLEWNDIDLKTGLLRVRQASQYIPGQGTITKDTKNDSSYRIISLPAVAVKMLTKYKSWQNEEKVSLFASCFLLNG